MNSRQRKAHKYIWLLLLIAVPLVMIFSIKDLDVFSSENNTAIVFESSKNSVLKTAENEILKASLIKKDSTYSLEVILKKPLRQPALVLESLKPKGKTKLIGQLSSVGIYKFEVDETIETIILRDPLKKDSINAITVLPL